MEFLFPKNLHYSKAFLDTFFGHQKSNILHHVTCLRELAFLWKRQFITLLKGYLWPFCEKYLLIPSLRTFSKFKTSTINFGKASMVVYLQLLIRKLGSRKMHFARSWHKIFHKRVNIFILQTFQILFKPILCSKQPVMVKGKAIL